MAAGIDSASVADQIDALVFRVLADLSAGRRPALSGRSNGSVRCRAASFAQQARLLTLVQALVHSGSVATKRDLYYLDRAFWGFQGALDRRISRLCVELGRPCWELNVVATSKTALFGRCRFRLHADATAPASASASGGAVIDCADEPKLLPSDLRRIAEVQCDAEYILVVEKDAVFQHLVQRAAALGRRFGAPLLLTSRGFPEVAARHFLARLCCLLGHSVPAFALVDADPYGLEIFACYQASPLPGLRLLGLRPADLDRLMPPAAQRLPLTPADRRRLDSLAGRVPSLAGEAAALLRLGWKCEIEALYDLGADYLTADYLPARLREEGMLLGLV